MSEEKTLQGVIDDLTALRDKFDKMGDQGRIGGLLTSVYLNDCIQDLTALRDRLAQGSDGIGGDWTVEEIRQYLGLNTGSWPGVYGPTPDENWRD